MTEGSPKRLPPPEYWDGLNNQFEVVLVSALKGLSDARRQEFGPRDLGLDVEAGKALLDQVATDGWVTQHIRYRCPKCEEELTLEQASDRQCPFTECSADYKDNGGAVSEVCYRRSLASSRSVSWVVAIHGMKSRGEWQERLTWLVSTTWGRAIPTAIYKYGFVVPGVVLFWRRKKLKNELRVKLLSFKADLEGKAVEGNPDVIAHSFGTWLFGHLCLGELKKPLADRICFGRVILVGCILRPDFDWQTLKKAGIVSEVLNHFGDRDYIVPLAHYTIWDSGPSGRQGFTGTEVANVRAHGYGHDDLLSMVKTLPPSTETEVQGVKQSFMGSALYTVWRPFLELPSEELVALATESGGGAAWRSSFWLLRGTVFPALIIPALIALVIWPLTLWLQPLKAMGHWVGVTTIWIWSAIGVYAVLVSLSMTWNWLLLRAQRIEAP